MKMLQNLQVLLTFDKVHNPLRLPREATSEPPKVVRTPGVFNILTSKCASRHNGVHFFDISTSKSGPTMVCFVQFDFEMCFAPQRRALFRHFNFQKWSETCCVLQILTSKCASRHNGVQFFISHLASWLRTRRFSEPTFRPSGAPNHWKNTVFRDFPTFSRICIFFLLTLSLLLIFSLLLFSLLLSLLSDSSAPALLFICPYCRKFDFQTSFDYCFIDRLDIICLCIPWQMQRSGLRLWGVG